MPCEFICIVLIVVVAVALLASMKPRLLRGGPGQPQRQFLQRPQQASQNCTPISPPSQTPVVASLPQTNVCTSTAAPAPPLPSPVVPVILGAKQLSRLTPGNTPNAPITLLTHQHAPEQAQQRQVTLETFVKSWNMKRPNDNEWIKIVLPEQWVAPSFAHVISQPASVSSSVYAPITAPEPFPKFVTDAETFKVIGIIGKQGVGKTMLMNAMAGVYTFENHDYMPELTTGVHMTISPEHVVLLDSQPVQSPELLSRLMNNPPTLPAGIASVEALLELQSLQIAVFLLTVCHVVVVVQDNVADVGLWNLLRTAEMIKERIPDVSAQQTPDPTCEEYTADLVLVCNQLSEEIIDKKTELVPIIQQSFERYFHDTVFVRGRAGGVPVLMVPTVYARAEAPEGLYNTHTIDSVVNSLMQLPVRQFARSLSHREWLRNSGRVWELIRKSPIIADYMKTYQRCQL